MNKINNEQNLRPKIIASSILLIIGLASIAIMLYFMPSKNEDKKVLKYYYTNYYKNKVEEAKESEIHYKEAFKEMENFCGKGNVWEGSGIGECRIFGCKDYSIVDKNNKEPILNKNCWIGFEELSK